MIATAACLVDNSSGWHLLAVKLWCFDIDASAVGVAEMTRVIGRMGVS